MGDYATPADVRKVLAPDGDTGPSTAASLDDPALEDAIQEAEQQVDAALAGRYPVPFGTGVYPQVPPMIVQLTRDMAAYEATLRFFRGQPLPAGHPVLLRAQRAQQTLRDMSSGRVELPETVPQETPTSQASVQNPYTGDLFGLPGMSIGEDGRPRPPGDPFGRW